MGVCVVPQASSKVTDGIKCYECKKYIGMHERIELSQCLRKLSKKAEEGLVAVPYPFDKAYDG